MNTKPPQPQLTGMWWDGGECVKVYADRHGQEFILFTDGSRLYFENADATTPTIFVSNSMPPPHPLLSTVLIGNPPQLVQLLDLPVVLGTLL